MHQHSPLWSLEEIEADEPSRAERLRSAPTADQLAVAVLAALEAAIAGNKVRVGMEQSVSNSQDLRVTIQLHVGEVLSDQFFNSNSGYRAEYRRGWQRGLSYNKNILTKARSIIEGTAPSVFSGRLLTSEFDDLGPRVTTRDEVIDSLVPKFSKVWFCAKLISTTCGVMQLPSGAVGPRLLLNDGTCWASIWRGDEDSWLDIKGAFVGADGPYQPKCPIERAKKLQKSGEA